MAFKGESTDNKIYAVIAIFIIVVIVLAIFFSSNQLTEALSMHQPAHREYTALITFLSFPWGEAICVYSIWHDYYLLGAQMVDLDDILLDQR